ncbi:HupE/UreJ family protein [Devosia sp. A449]
MTAKFVRLTVVVLALAAMPSMAFAHTDIGGGGFTYGFLHPWSGLDHILAMVMVGLLAFQLGGRALWLVPATFISVMVLGGALGVAGFAVPFVEVGIALSVIVLGAVAALNVKAPVAAAMGLVGLFAIFHDHAHGAEMPALADGLSFGTGFVLATALLHGAGIGLGYTLGLAGNRYGSMVSRAAGGLAAVAGVGILTGML